MVEKHICDLIIIKKELVRKKDSKFLEESNGIMFYQIISAQQNNHRYFCFLQVHDKILLISYDQSDQSVSCRSYGSEDYEAHGFADMMSFIKGLIRIHEGDLKLYNDLACAAGLTKVHWRSDCKYGFEIPRSIDEVIADFDPDIEGITPVVFDEDAEANRFQTVKNDLDHLQASSLDGRPLTDGIYSDVARTLFGHEYMLRPYVIRALKTLVRVLDKHNIKYSKASEIQSSVDKLAHELDRNKIRYDIFYFPKD